MYKAITNFKTIIFISLLLLIFSFSLSLAQEKEKKQQIKNSQNTIETAQAVEGDVIFSDGTNQLLRITDEGDFGSIQILNGVPLIKTNKLYNNNGHLYFNGTSLDSTSNLVDSLNKLTDAIYDGESLFLGVGTGINDDAGASDGNKNFNLGIGKNALSTNTSGNRNAAIGYESQYFNVTGNRNTTLGNASQYNNFSGNANVALGFQSNYFNETGENNTLIGTRAGYGSTGNSFSGNVFIGYQAGYNETASDKLYIENSDSDTPLIWGDFDTDSIKITGKLETTGRINTSRIQIRSGASDGYILTSDSEGKASWQDNANPKVAFSAYLTSEKHYQFQDVGTDLLIDFTELFDEGNGFNPTNGEFIAPSSGLYHFDLNFNWIEESLSPNYSTFIYIKNNGASFPGSNFIIRHEFEESSFSNQSVSFNKFLNANDIITILVDAKDNAANGAPPGLYSGGKLEGGNNGNSSTVSGFKVY